MTEQNQPFAFRHLLYLLLSLVMVTAPHAEHLPWWIIALAAMLFAWRTYLGHARLADPGLPLPPAATSAGAGAERGSGQEDFSGLRQYHVGDSPRHVAWKAAARDQGLLTKQFSGRAETELWLDWAQLPPQLGVEERLAHLARWVVDAHAAGLSYGLRLPGETVDMAAGDAQRERCLEALALYDGDQ